MNSKFDKTKLLLGAQIEDTSFRNLVIDSQVLATNDFFKWKWEIIEELLCGPLLNPRRLEEILKSTKLIKRLISFYRPQKRRFSNIKIAKGSDKYVRLGCALMRVLLGSTEGVRYLADARLINYIADCFQELDPVSTVVSHQIFDFPIICADEWVLKIGGTIVFKGTHGENVIW
jgi:hypothetical protein